MSIAKIHKGALPFIIVLLLPLTVLAESADVKLLRQARSQIGIVAGELKQRVAEDVREKGAENALSSCRLRVDGLVDRLTEQSGWVIRRTAFKVRNPNNKPDAWERDVLDLFARRQSEGVDLKTFEFARLMNVDGQRVLRYMKPIVMQDFCVTCHGSNISPAVAEKIVVKYPEDQAVDFQPGQLRGAFSLMRILPGDPP